VDATLFDVADPDPDPVLAADPVGPVLDTTVGPWGLATASFSLDRVHRYRLSRVFYPAGHRVCFVMLNPSTADAFVLDPTVRRCVGFASAWGAGAVEVVNLFALRSTDPAGLRRCSDPVGPGNDAAIVAAARAADRTVAAWGAHGVHLDREAAVVELLAAAGVDLYALSLTKNGHPGHPLYLPGRASPTLWREAG
jgi:hypothetical protein